MFLQTEIFKSFALASRHAILRDDFSTFILMMQSGKVRGVCVETGFLWKIQYLRMFSAFNIS